MRQIGIFGGTFDPIHFGHIHLAVALAEAHQLEEVWWVPACISPFKKKLPVEASHRLAMLKAALEKLPQFKILDLELTRKGPSYTVDTLILLKEQFPQYVFHLLFADDVLPRFLEWKEPQKILELAKPLIGSRQSKEFPSDLHLPEDFKWGWTPIPLLEISATDLRDRLKRKKFCGCFIPEKVLDYIEEHHLYL